MLFTGNRGEFILSLWYTALHDKWFLLPSSTLPDSFDLAILCWWQFPLINMRQRSTDKATHEQTCWQWLPMPEGLVFFKIKLTHTWTCRRNKSTYDLWRIFCQAMYLGERKEWWAEAETKGTGRQEKDQTLTYFTYLQCQRCPLKPQRTTM